jgi:hypothetical protein
MSRCIFHRIQTDLDDTDRAVLKQMLDTAGHLTVARIMTDAGYRMSEHTVRRHRKGDCQCAAVTI